MAKGAELVARDQPLDRGAFPGDMVAIHRIDGLGRQHEEAAVDGVALFQGLFDELGDLITVQFQRAETSLGGDGGHRGQLAAATMEVEQGTQVDVGQAVAVGEKEGLLVGKEVLDAGEAAAGHRLFAGVDEGDAPGLRMLLMHLHAVVAHVEGDVGGVQEIVGEVLLDDVPLVAQADDEVGDAVAGEDLHQMPENGAPADLHHGLRFQMGLFGQAATQAARQDDSLHASRLKGQWGHVSACGQIPVGKQRGDFPAIQCPSSVAASGDGR